MDYPAEAVMFATALRSARPEDQIELGKLVGQMTSTPGWARLVELVQAYRRNLEQAPVIAEHVWDQAAYAEHFGRIAGLACVIALPDAVESVASDAESELARIGEQQHV